MLRTAALSAVLVVVLLLAGFGLWTIVRPPEKPSEGPPVGQECASGTVWNGTECVTETGEELFTAERTLVLTIKDWQAGAGLQYIDVEVYPAGGTRSKDTGETDSSGQITTTEEYISGDLMDVYFYNASQEIYMWYYDIEIPFVREAELEETTHTITLPVFDMITDATLDIEDDAGLDYTDTGWLNVSDVGSDEKAILTITVRNTEDPSSIFLHYDRIDNHWNLPVVLAELTGVGADTVRVTWYAKANRYSDIAATKYDEDNIQETLVNYRVGDDYHYGEVLTAGWVLPGSDPWDIIQEGGLWHETSGQDKLFDAVDSVEFEIDLLDYTVATTDLVITLVYFTDLSYFQIHNGAHPGIAITAQTITINLGQT